MLADRVLATVRANRPRWEGVATVAALVILLALFLPQITTHAGNGADFAADYQAAHALRAHLSPSVQTTERIAGRVSGNGYFYAPTFAFLVLPLTLAPLPVARALWGLATMGFLLLAIYALFRAAGKRPSWLVLLALADVAALTTALRSEVFYGNVNLFLLCCLSVALWARQERRLVLAAALLAFACATKPFWLPLPILLLWKREYRFAGGALALFCGLLLVPFAWLGLHSLRTLLGVWAYFVTNYLNWSENFALAGILARLFTANVFIHPLVDAPLLALVLWLAASSAITVAALALVERRPLRRDTQSLLEVGTLVAAVLLISPLIEPAFLSVLVIAEVALYLRLAEEPSRAHRGVAAGVALAWLAEVLPHRWLENYVWIKAAQTTPLDYLFMVTGATHFYVVLVVFALQLVLLRQAAGQRFAAAIPRFFHDLGQVPRQTLADLAAARRYRGADASLASSLRER